MNELTTTTRANPPSEIVKLRGQLEQRAGELKMALPAGISVEKFSRTVTTAVQQSPALLNADRQSLILACMKAAQDGLLPDGREAALVIFSTRVKNPTTGAFQSVQLVQYMPMVYGLRKKILQAVDVKGHPIVSSLAVGVVYRAEVEQGYFVWERNGDPEVQHRPMLDLTSAQTEDSEIVAAYSIATMSDGTRSYEVLRRFEIDKIRQKSQTGALGQTVRFGQNAGKAIEPKGPWVDWFAEMAKKTAMRRHSKTLPMSGDVFLELERNQEADELNAAMGATALLGSSEGSAPVDLEEGGERFDPDTGESLGSDDPAPAIEAKAEPAKAKPKAAAKPKAEPKVVEERQPEAAETSTEPAKVETDEADDRHPAEATAERLNDDMARASTVIDLKRTMDEARNAGHLEAMPEELLNPVLNNYERHWKRLGGKPAVAKQPETAE